MSETLEDLGVTFNCGKQMAKEADEWIEEEDKKRKKRLKRQARKYIETIDRVEKALIKYKLLAPPSLRKHPNRMKEYVDKYKWLPPSYRKMLRQWARLLKKRFSCNIKGFHRI